MRDSEVVAAIVAGEPDGLATAYDRYAGPLFRYCQSLLSEPHDAADAVQDTFVIAASKLARLRNPERLQAWLFAVARNECLHRLKSRQAAAPVQDIPEWADESADVSAEAERAEARALIRAAVGGLNAGERDVINQYWHGLDVQEVAAVLGVSRNHAHSLFSRARDQLAASVGVLVVGRSGRKDCPALDGLLHDWDGRLTARLRKRVGRHIDRCATCSDRRRREVRPAALFAMTPAALFSLAALRNAAGTLTAPARPAMPPSGLREEVLRQAGARHTAGTHAAGTHAAGAHAAGAHATAGGTLHVLGLNGFPRPLPAGQWPLARLTHLHLAMTGGTAAAATVLVTTVAPTVLHVPAGPGNAPGQCTATAEPGYAGPAGPAGAPPSGHGIPGRRGTPTARPARTGTPPASTTLTSATKTGAPAITPGTAGPAASPAPTMAASLSASPAPGGVSLSATTIVIRPGRDATLRLTAGGQPVSWAISEPSSLTGSLKVSPSSGHLAAAGSATVRLSETGPTSAEATLLVSPGGQPVTVVLERG